MIKIAIVDDNSADSSRLKSQIEGFFFKQNLAIDITVFNSSFRFVDTFSDNYDCIFLDIDMPIINGIDVAYKIREISPNVSIVFETNYSSLAIKGYGVYALGFIVKPVREVDVEAILLKLLDKISKEKDDLKIVIKVKSGFRTVKVNEIKYIEVDVHDIYYHCVNNVIQTRGVLKDIESCLDPSKFVKCNNCYLINLDYVESVIKNDVKIDGKLLKISRNKKKTFINAYLNNYNS